MKQAIWLMSFFSLLGIGLYAQVDTILWNVDNLDEIGGYETQLIGNPQLIETELGYAIEFDGIDDGIIVPNNPLAGATSFTVEIVFKPYLGGPVEQRFLHVQQDNDNRMLIELRNPNNENWSLDTFIKSGTSNRALLDYSYTHELDQWAHAALVYEEGVMTHYVNGERELEGTVAYQVVNSGETSLGVRLNRVSWFKGAIRAVKITHTALSPDDFLTVDALTSTQELNSTSFQLQITPNPSVEKAEVSYFLALPQRVVVRVQNMQGQTVATLFTGRQAAGKHKLSLDSSTLAVGTYLVLVEAGGQQAVTRLVVGQ